MLNGLLGLAVVGGIAVAYLVVTDEGNTAPVAARTVTVSRGEVTATVTGSGNIASGRTSTSPDDAEDKPAFQSEEAQAAIKASPSPPWARAPRPPPREGAAS